MTSGMSAKGSALGAGAPGGDVASSRAPMPRAAGNGTKPDRESADSSESSTGTNFQEAGITDTPETSHPALSSSVRTLILGIDYDGRIVQHDRNAAKILARQPEELLGAQLIELTSGSHGNHGRRTRRRATRTRAARVTPRLRWPGCSRPSVRIVRAVPCSRSTPATAPRPKRW